MGAPAAEPAPLLRASEPVVLPRVLAAEVREPRGSPSGVPRVVAQSLATAPDSTLLCVLRRPSRRPADASWYAVASAVVAVRVESGYSGVQTMVQT